MNFVECTVCSKYDDCKSKDVLCHECLGPKRLRILELLTKLEKRNSENSESIDLLEEIFKQFGTYDIDLTGKK